MSTTIDERVVSMKFDNKQFESNVSTSMNTLEKLKKSLNLKDSAKGLEEVGKAAKNFNISPLSNGVESVTAKFSALQVMGVTALANITNSAVNAGKKLVSAFTIDPIKSGFQEYETQINAVQTILANTSSKGTTLDQVNNALDTLNTYADKTIYNFTEMTRNIGTFTAAGIDLDTSVSAIQGIANLAAVSGSTSQQASTAMYQLSQALAAGTVKLMDWNSVVNAGMGGEVFQNALKKTSEELGTGAEAAIKAQGSFRESLQTGWLTSEVLTQTLKKFTESGATEYVAEYCGVSADAVQAALDEAKAQYGEAEAIDKASEALANKYGKNKDEIKSVLEMAKTSTEAATKVKTFSQLMDTLKEAVQSGWTQSWEILIGDFEEAKELFTKISDTVGAIIQKSADSRNAILQGAFGSKWEEFSKKVEEAGVPLDAFKEKLKEVASENGVSVDDLVKEYGSLESAINKGKISSDIFVKTLKSFAGVQDETVKSTGDMTGKLEEFQKVVNDVWSGEYKNGEERVKALTEAGYDYAKVQDLVNKTVDGHKLTLEDLGDEQLKNIGYTDEQISEIRKLAEEAEKTGTPLNQLIESMSKPTGRELLIQSACNAFEALKKIIGPVADAYNEIFNPKSDAEKAASLYGVIEAVNKFSQKLIISNGTAKKVERTFKGVFAILDLLRMVVGGGLSIAFKVLNTVLGMFDMNIWDVTAVIGDAAVAVRDFIKEHDVLTAAIEFIVPLIVKAATAIADWAANSETLQNAISSVTNFLSDAKDAFSEWINSFDDAESIPEHILSGLKNGITNGLPDLASAALEIGKTILEAVKDFLGIHSPSKEFESVGEFSIEELIKGIQNKLSDLRESAGNIGETLMDVFSDIDLEKIFAVLLSGGMSAAVIKIAKALEAFSKPAEGIGDVLSGTGDVLSGFGKVLSESAKSISKVIKSFSKVLKGFSKVLNGLAFDLKAKAFLKIAIALAILVAAVALLTLVDQDKLKSAAGTIVVLAGVLAALAFALSKMSGDLVSIDENGVKVSDVVPKLVGIGIAVMMIAGAVALIGSLKPEQFKQGMLGMLAIVGGFVAIIGLMGLLSKGGYDSAISKVGGMMVKLSIALLLMVGVIKLIAMLSPTEMVIGVATMVIFGAFVAILAKVAGNNGFNADKLGSMMIKLSIALLLMVGVVKILGEMDTWALLRGGIAITVLSIIIAQLVKSVAKHQGEIPKIGKCLLAISTAMLIMSGVIKILGGMDITSLLKGVAVITYLAIIIALLIDAVAKHQAGIPKLSLTLIALSVAIAILAGVAVILSLINVASLAKGVIAVGVLGTVMAGMIWAARGANDCKDNIIAMTVAISLMAVAVAALSFLDPARLGTATLAMSILMGIFAVLIKVAGDAQGALPTLITMTVAVGLLGGMLGLLAQLPWKQTLGAAAGLSLVLLSFAAAMKIISSCGSISATTLVALGIMVLVVGVLTLLIGALSNIDASNIMNIVGPLALLAGTMAILAIGVNAMSGALSGAAALLVASVSLMALVNVLQVLGGLSIGEIIKGIITLAVSLGVLIAAGYLATGAVPGLLGLGAAIVLIGVGALAAGAGLLAFSAGLASLAVSGVAGMAALSAIILQIIAFIPTIIVAIGQGLLMLVEFIGNSATTIATAVIQVGSAILTTLVTLIPQLIEVVITIIDSLLNSIAEHTPSIVAAGCDIVIGLINGISEKIPDIINAGFNLIISFINGLSQAIVDNAVPLRDAMVNLCTSIWTAICEFFGIHSPSTKFAEIGMNLILGLIEGIGNFVGNVVSKIKEVAGNMLDAAKDKLKKFKDKGKEAMDKLKSGINDKKKAIKDKAKEVASKAVDGLKSKLQKFKDVGKNLIEGLKEGIKGAASKVIDSVKGVAQDAIDGAKALLGIHSPSRVFAEIGRFTDEGFVIGLEKYAGKVEDASAGVGQKAVDGISNAISNIGEISDIDVAPSIRPVLDMDGVNYRNLQLNADLSTVMTKPVNSLGNLMTETQNAINASNNRVISAINGLRDEFSEFANMDDTEIGFYVDGKKLASSLARPMNRELNVLARRGGI